MLHQLFFRFLVCVVASHGKYFADIPDKCSLSLPLFFILTSYISLILGQCDSLRRLNATSYLCGFGLKNKFIFYLHPIYCLMFSSTTEQYSHILCIMLIPSNMLALLVCSECKAQFKD